MDEHGRVLPGWKCAEHLPLPTPSPNYPRKAPYLTERQRAFIKVYLLVDIFMRREDLQLSNDRPYHEEIWEEAERRNAYFLEYIEWVGQDRAWEFARDLKKYGVVRRGALKEPLFSFLGPDREGVGQPFRQRLIPKAIRIWKMWEDNFRDLPDEYGENIYHVGDFFEDHIPLPKPHKRFRVEPGVKIKQEPE